MRTVREHVLEEVEEYKRKAARMQECADTLMRLLVKIPRPVRELEVPNGYEYGRGKSFAISNRNDEVRGLAGKIAIMLDVQDKINVQHTGKDPAQGLNYFQFDLGDGFRLDVDCKHRPICQTVLVRHVVEETITVCGELPEGYERVEEEQ